MMMIQITKMLIPMEIPLIFQSKMRSVYAKERRPSLILSIANVLLVGIEEITCLSTYSDLCLAAFYPPS